MAQVVTRCSVIGRVVLTGSEMSRVEFDGLDRPGSVFTCTGCGQMHFWAKRSSWLAEDPKEAGKIAA